MPPRVHALIVARTGSSASASLSRTLDALTAQSVPPAAVTVVVLGDAAAVRAIPGIGGTVEGIIEARTGTSFSEAVALAQPRVRENSSVWLLADDTVPDRDALQLLAGALERSPSAAVAAPKLVQNGDDREIVSMGVSMTSGGRTVELAAGELDQGQHDDAEDALGSDVRGILIRGEAPTVLRPDVALAGADEGLDLGIRARLGGARLVLVPGARIGVPATGASTRPNTPIARAWASRRSQLHRRLAYAPAALVPLHWISLLPLALWRSITHLIAKHPGEVAPEWGAALTSMVRVGAVARSRRAIRSFRRTSWAEIAPLRVTRAQLKVRLDDGHGTERGVVSELNFFGGGGAWAVLAALVVNVVAFVSMLAWPALGGGALLPMRQTVVALWTDTAWGLRDVGLGVVGPADPFTGVLALVGSLSPAAPSAALVGLWLLALPLAVLGGWFASTRVTDRAGLRILGGVLWALAPTFLTALVQGRPAAVLLHLLLPWVFHTVSVAHRSWGAAGAASLLTVAALACAPSLAPAFVVIWVLTLVLLLAGRRLRGVARVFWVLIPSAAMFAPLVVRQLRDRTPWGLLADPGAVLVTGGASRADIALGFPSPDRGGWDWFLGGSMLTWVPLLLAPLALLALASALSPRWRAGYVLLATALLGVGTALLASHVVVAFAAGVGVAVWPGTGLSLAWLGVVGAALVTLDTVVAFAPLRTGAAVVAALAIVVCAVPGLLAQHAGHSEVQNGPTSTLPALVAAQAGGDADRGTLVITPRNDGSVSAQVVWGASATLGAQSTLLTTATHVPGNDIAATAVDMLSGRDFNASGALAADGVSFVLLAQTPDEQDRARALRDQATESIDARSGFIKAGQTTRGMLWRIDGNIAPRAALTTGQSTVASLVTLVQFLILAAALLLAIPTRSSRRAARSRSRIVGREASEPIVLPRRRISDHADEHAAVSDAAASDTAPDAAASDTVADADAPTADAPEAPADTEATR